MTTRSADPLYIGNRPLHVQERFLTRCANGPRETSEENHLVVCASRALAALRVYEAAFEEAVAASKPFARGDS